jgi:EAL domain-containing protein (putative c-di-GMP-specific phosphodiesterase class I)
VLVLDDDQALMRTFLLMARHLGIEARTCSSVAEFEAALGAFRPDVVLVDLMMPEIDGIEVLARVSPLTDARICIMTGADKRTVQATLDVLARASIAVAGVLPKPFGIAQLRLLIDEPERPCQAPPIWEGSACKQGSPLTRAQFTQAVHEGLVEPSFQPIFLADRRTLKGFEALARIEGEDPSLFPAAWFEHLLADDALARELTRQVTGKALAFLAGLPGGERLSVSINVFGTHAVASGFRETLTHECARHGLAHRQIILELSEASVFELDEGDLRKMTQLRLAGFGLSIDDLGTGNSSLGRLASLPFSEMKVDKSFCLALPQSESAKAVVEACLGLARRLDMEVTAEGVESREVAVMLGAMGCSALQGHFFGHAMPAEEAAAWTRQGCPRAARAA